MSSAHRPRILLVPALTELEWELIRPHLEQWAEVASFDAAGDTDPAPGELTRAAIADRGLEELDRLGWERCFLVGDSWGGATAALIGRARPEAVQGFAFGHARLSNSMEGDRPTVNKGVWEAMAQLAEQDYPLFVAHGLAQITHGSVPEGLAERMLERVPIDVGLDAWRGALREDAPILETLKALDCPLLFAKHEGCLGSTEEGFADIVAAFPEARTLSVPRSPATSLEFADALRSFCLEVAESSPA
jgi:pimeloyl-ACP methyl ester carboxylesterase